MAPTGGGQEVCDDLSTGHQPGDGDNDYTITAPAGMLIVKTCVKAGSSMSGGGVQYQTYSPGVASATIYGPAGKTISHWSAEYVPMAVYTGTATVSGSQDICTAEDETVTISYTSGLVTRTSTESQAAADAAAQAAAQAAAEADLAEQLEDYPGYTPGVCQGTTVYTGEATVSGSQQICTAAGATVTIAYTSGLVTRTSTESQAAADAAAQAAAQTAADADLAEQLEDYPGYTSGACTPTTPPTPPPTTPPASPPPSGASAPASVAPVLPAVVETPTPTPTPTPTVVAVPLPATADEPETVAVPKPATVPVPTSVPAGDGSSSGDTPIGAWLLVGAGLSGLIAAASRLRLGRQDR